MCLCVLTYNMGCMYMHVCACLSLIGLRYIYIYIYIVVVVVMCCACVVNDFYLRTNAIGPVPTGVTVSPNGCQSLLVTWTHRAPTSPLTLNHYRVEFQAQGGSQQTVTTTSQASYTLTGLAPATTYAVRVRAQTQLGYGFACCEPTATTPNGEATFDACMGSQGDCGTLRVSMSQQCFWYTV